MSAAIEVLHVLDQHRERAAVADMTGTIGIDARDELMEQLTALEEAKGRIAQKQSRLILQDASATLLAAGVTDVKLTQRHGSLVECLTEAKPRTNLVLIGKRGEYAAREPLLKGLDCHLLTVGTASEEADRHLGWARGLLEASGYTIRAEILAGAPEEVIHRAIEPEAGCLLVMGA